ncbi:unnamed protein product [Rotaria sp. Silwood1]|nr:unnamed protein product [Rotaria sp. Silwood1]
MKPTLKINFLSSNHTSMLTTLHQQQKHCIVYLKVRSGRLGNRMFMIASAYGLARLHSCHLYITPEIINEVHALFILDLSPFLISTTMFNSIIHNTLKPMTTIRKHAGCQYVRELTRPNAISPEHILELHENHQLFKKQLTQSNWKTWIGIHIRRDDFVPLNFSSSDEYLFAAIDYYMRRYPNAHFIVASDDKSYCKNLFRHRSNIIVTPKSFSMGDDLIALSLCEHSIITGGTFGWWTGYLASGEVIHDTMYISGCEKDEHYYPPWFKTHLNLRKDKNIL